MHVKKRKDSSSEDEDDVPLKIIKMKKDYLDPNAYDTLILPSTELCELCDKVLKNRYASIIHNVHHIIIPLLNQKVLQCEICLHHFTSHKDLIWHKAKKHSLSEILSQTDLVKTSFNNPTDGTYESDLITIVKNESPMVQVKNMIKEKPIVKMENLILEKPIVKMENQILEKPIVKVENFILQDEEIILSDDDDCEFDLDTMETVSDYGGSSLKNRLVFEEDDIISFNNDKVLNDLTTNCKVQVELFPPMWVEKTESVHYDELIKPGVFRCKRCSKTFSSRYEVIMHESQHILIKDSQITLCKTCNRYILGDFNDLKYHYMTIHSIKLTQNKDITRKYLFGKIENGFVCQPLEKKTVTMKLCEVCFTFCQNKGSRNYYCIGELNEIGKRHRCDKCGLKFFAIKLIKRQTMYRYVKKNRHSNIHKAMTNETRLKVISQRFKKMKKKYFVVLFMNILVIAIMGAVIFFLCNFMAW